MRHRGEVSPAWASFKMQISSARAAPHIFITLVRMDLSDPLSGGGRGRWRTNWEGYGSSHFTFYSASPGAPETRIGPHR